MTIVCFVSGSGTNYQRIVAFDPEHDYVVFSNRPGCEGIEKARSNHHQVVELSHLPYLKAAKTRLGMTGVPRNCPEREQYEKDAWELIENRLGRSPDLVCLAGYDQWLTDWTVARYYPRILNIHPGDTTRGYAGLHWVPTAKAILNGDRQIRSTVFLVDMGEDTGPVLAQSSPVDIELALRQGEAGGSKDLLDHYRKVMDFQRSTGITTYEAFDERGTDADKLHLRTICLYLQDYLKKAGDWQIYPLAVHELIGRGRVEVVDRTIFVDGCALPEHGFRPDAATPV